MKSIISTYVTIVGFCLTVLICSAMLMTQLQISGARTFHAYCLNSLQSSYYNDDVYKACQTEATARGYSLEMENVAVYKGRTSRLVTLDYDVVVPFVGVDKIHGTVTGYGK